MAARYLADSQESAAIYRDEGLIHPRDILRACNFVISRNVQPESRKVLVLWAIAFESVGALVILALGRRDWWDALLAGSLAALNLMVIPFLISRTSDAYGSQ